MASWLYCNRHAPDTLLLGIRASLVYQVLRPHFTDDDARKTWLAPTYTSMIR